MRVRDVIPLSASVGAMAALLSACLLIGIPSEMQAQSNACRSRIGAAAAACAVPEVQHRTDRALPAGDAPAFLFAAVQPIRAPEPWRAIYHEVERCAGMAGDYDQIRWAVMEAPLQGPKGPTYGFNVGSRIVLVRQDTTYLRHEMLHHILQVAGWQPPPLRPGEGYSIADLHPMPFFGACAGGTMASAG